MSAKVIDVRARVSGYMPNAMRDHFDSGAFASYDASELELLSPDHLRGNHLTIYHTGNLPAASSWREVGKELRFSIKEDDLAPGNTIFDGALSDVQDAS